MFVLMLTILIAFTLGLTAGLLCGAGGALACAMGGLCALCCIGGVVVALSSYHAAVHTYPH